MLKLGSHVSMSGSSMLLGSVEEAISYGATAFMVYTGAPQNTYRKPIKDLNISNAHILMKKHGLSLDNIVVHAPYIINLANPDETKRQFAIDFLTEEIKRSDVIGASQMVLHPGNAVGGDREQAKLWIGEGLNKIISNTKDSQVKIALETMAGKGTEIGITFDEIKELIDLVNDKTRVSVCFDTCHTSDSGYSIRDDFDGVIEEFDKIVGIDKISVLHINDSKNIQGAKKDRHANIGFGEIGFETIIKIIYDERFKDIPKILETPYYENKAPYKFEIDMIKNKTFNPNILEDILNS
ncbi:MAG: deoxyribonuclease IV [Acholeplasmataceae bacterium]|nr:deoxyribonuclease IV [Acholeplasmataceae bacterium]